jgi:hypothetical protein
MAASLQPQDMEQVVVVVTGKTALAPMVDLAS